MNTRSRLPQALLLAVAGILFSPDAAWACVACFGRSDSQLASGMNWGIFTLLGFVGFVLSGFAALMIYLIRKSGEGADAIKPSPASNRPG